MNSSASARLSSSGLQVGGIQISQHAIRFTLGALVLLATAIVAARMSTALFIVIGLSLLVSLAYASYRWPQAMILVVALSPIVDRYAVALLVPDDLELITRFFSEGVLLVAGLSIGVRAAINGRLLPALTHPLTVVVGLFIVVAAASAVANGVSPLIAFAGVVFTVDAIALFYLPRLAPFTPRQAWGAVTVFVGASVMAAMLAIAQVVLAPDILGLAVSAGRFGEGSRVGGFLAGNPNILGALLGMAIPFALFAVVRVPRTRWRVLALTAAFLMVLALLFTYSRGAWVGLAAGLLGASLLIDRRVIVLGVLLAVLAYGSAQVMPRNLLPPGPGEAPAQTSTDFIGTTISRINIIDEGRDLRVQFVQQGLGLLTDSPVLGLGPGRYGGAVAQQFGSPVYDQLGDAAPKRMVDNFWLHLVVELGILGATILAVGILWLAIDIVRRTWRKVLVPAIAGGALAAAGLMVVDSLTEMILEGNTLAFMMWFMLGLASSTVAHATRRPAPAAQPMAGAAAELQPGR